MVSTYLLLFCTIVISGCQRNPNAPISDAELIRIDNTAFDMRSKMGSHEVIGVSRGHHVLIDYPCGDLCPEETDRLIHFDVEPGAACKAIGGVSWSGMISSGYQSHACIPQAIYHGGNPDVQPKSTPSENAAIADNEFDPRVRN